MCSQAGHHVRVPNLLHVCNGNTGSLFSWQQRSVWHILHNVCIQAARMHQHIYTCAQQASVLQILQACSYRSTPCTLESDELRCMECASNEPFSSACRDFQGLPRPCPLPSLNRQGMLERAAEMSANNDNTTAPGSSTSSSSGKEELPFMINTTSSDVLAEMLRHQKRAYWPFAWDSDGPDSYSRNGNNSHGGFR